MRLVGGQLVLQLLSRRSGLSMRSAAFFQGLTRLIQQRFGFVQTAVGLIHGGFNQAQTGAKAFGLAVQTVNRIGAVLDAVTDLAQRFTGGVQRIVLAQQRVMRLTERLLDLLQLIFAGSALFGGLGQHALGLAHRVAYLQKSLFGGGFLLVQTVVAHKIQPHIQLAQGFGQSQIFLGYIALFFEGREMAFQLIQHVQHAHKVFIRTLQTAFGFLLAGAEAADTGGFFKDHAAVLAALAQNFVNSALADDGIAFLAHAGVAEQVDDIAQTAARAVHQVFAFAAAVDAAGDADLVIRHVQLVVGVVKGERYFAVIERLALFGAVEDDVGHALTAQHLGALFAQHPAHGVADVALAAAVGANNARYVLRKDDLRALGERLKAVYFQFG